MKKILLLLIASFVLVSCSKGGDDTKARLQVDAEDRNRRELNVAPEKELNEIKYFMKAVEGEYKGSIEISTIPLDVYIEIIPSKEIRIYDRDRTASEIQSDRDELTLTVRALIENPNVPNSGSTCIFEKQRPDINKGILKLIKENCNNSFRLGLGEGVRASDITSNNQVYIDSLSGSLSTGVSSKKHKLKLMRQ